MLELVFQNLTDSKSFKKDFFAKILNKAEKEVKLKNRKNGVSVNLVGESKIRELNKKYRQKDKATDVLSFPIQEAISRSRTSGSFRSPA